MASYMAPFFDYPRILRNDRHEPRQKFQGKSEYFPLSDIMRNILSFGGVRLRMVASDMDAVSHDPGLLHVCQQRKI